jgi:hypothetical protein
VNRLDNIVARNQRQGIGRLNERTGTMVMVGLFLLVIIALAAFTDLGRAKEDDAPAQLPREKSIHVPLGRPRTH